MTVVVMGITGNEYLDDSGCYIIVVVWLVLQLPVQLVTITTKVVSSTPDYREEHSIQH
jgi:hypothetical protein